MNIDQTANGSTITIQCQSYLQLSLPENPTTGFRWQDDSGIESKRLRVESVSFLPSVGIGAGGIRQWIFLAKESGKSNITLRYKRPWENDSPEDKTFQLIVEIT